MAASLFLVNGPMAFPRSDIATTADCIAQETAMTQVERKCIQSDQPGYVAC